MILYYHGPDTYSLQQAIRKERSTHSFDLATTTGRQECERILKYPSFFNERIFITGSNALADAETAATVYDLIKKYDVATMVGTILCVSIAEPAGRESAASKQLVTYLKKHSDQEREFPQLSGMALVQWVRDTCQQQGHTLAPAALAELISRTAGDSWALSAEISKICAFSHGETKPIDVHMIRQLVPAKHEHDEWELSNAITSKNKRGAIAALFRRLHQGTPEQMLLGSLAASIRTLLTVKDLADRGLTAPAIAKNSGLHPFVVSKTLRGSAAYTMPELQEALTDIARIDQASKNGQADATDSMFAVLLAL